eukprot:416591-Prorocentrum_minimum.AAC.2
MPDDSEEACVVLFRMQIKDGGTLVEPVCSVGGCYEACFCPGRTTQPVPSAPSGAPSGGVVTLKTNRR